MEKIIQVIKDLIAEVQQIELIYYKVASDNFWIYYEKDFNGNFGKSKYIQLFGREDKELEDFGYFNAIRDIFNEYIYERFPEENEEPEEALRIIKNIIPPDGALNFYGDYYYQKIANKITAQAIALNETLEIKDAADKELLKLQKLQALQYKKLINADEFELIFGKSKNTQLNYRSRSRNPMPYLGGGKGKDLMYNREAVEKWFENYL